ncbi:MAG: ABC transporter permease [Anaerolineales bacterium]|nr:ABC transporter permease [Anaerolineales bacterium]
MDFLISVVVLSILMFIYQVPLTLTAIIWLPIILLIQFLLIVGLGLALSAANVFFRDVTSLLSLGLQLWFYASPIIYPITSVPDSLRTLYFLNPMAGIIEAYRSVILEATPPDYMALGLAAIVSVIAFVFGYSFFKRVEFRFADIV